MLKSSFYNYSDVHIPEKWTMTITGAKGTGDDNTKQKK